MTGVQTCALPICFPVTIGKVDKLEGLKESVICGHLIPAGTGQPEREKIVVASRDEYEKIMQAKRSVTDVNLKEAEEVSF